jgi:hypothetical protein
MAPDRDHDRLRDARLAFDPLQPAALRQIGLSPAPDARGIDMLGAIGGKRRDRAARTAARLRTIERDHPVVQRQRRKHGIRGSRGDAVRQCLLSKLAQIRLKSGLVLRVGGLRPCPRDDERRNSGHTEPAKPTRCS